MTDTPEVPVVDTDDKDFADAFDDAVNDVDQTTVEVNKNENDTETIPDASEAPPEEEVTPETDASPKEEVTTEDTLLDDETDTPDTGPDYKDLYERELQRSNSWEGRINKAEQLAAESATELTKLKESKQEDTTKSDLTAEDEAKLEEFVKEFPELQAPIAALVRKEAGAMIASEVSPKLQHVEESVQATKETAASTAASTHMSTIKSAHLDFDNIAQGPDLTAWVNSLAGYIQEGAVRVMETGNATEVVQLINGFKESTFYKSETPTPKPEPTPKPKPDTKKDKASDLMAVESSSDGPPPGKPDPNDFDAAWDEATKTTK